VAARGARAQDLRVARHRVRRAVVLPRHLRVATGRALGAGRDALLPGVQVQLEGGRPLLARKSFWPPCRFFGHPLLHHLSSVHLPRLQSRGGNIKGSRGSHGGSVWVRRRGPSIDELQLLVERNWHVHLFPSWSNTADFSDTTERFGTVPLQSPALAAALATISLPAGVEFTADQQYLCDRMHTPAPLLPVHGEDECKLFVRMINNTVAGQAGDYEQMAVDWCAAVDGVKIFPKLPVYLRTHHARWQRNERVRRAVERAAPGEVVLAQINDRTARALLGTPAPAAAELAAAASPPAMPAAGASTAAAAAAAVLTPPALAAAAPFALCLPSCPCAGGGPCAAAPGGGGEAGVVAAPLASPYPAFAQHPPLPPPPVQGAASPVEAVILVGGVAVSGLQPPPPGPGVKRKNGERGGDTKRRKSKTCSNCKHWGGTDNPLAATCKGRAPRGTCQHYQPDGAPLGP
jgi:hypothetical protein